MAAPVFPNIRTVVAQALEVIRSSPLPDSTKIVQIALATLAQQIGEFGTCAVYVAHDLWLQFPKCAQVVLDHSKTQTLNTLMIPVGLFLLQLGQRLETDQTPSPRALQLGQRLGTDQTPSQEALSSPQKTTLTKKYLPTLLKIAGFALMTFSVVSSLYSIYSMRLSVQGFYNKAKDNIDDLVNQGYSQSIFQFAMPIHQTT